jgi:hypothetical protein
MASSFFSQTSGDWVNILRFPLRQPIQPFIDRGRIGQIHAYDDFDVEQRESYALSYYGWPQSSAYMLRNASHMNLILFTPVLLTGVSRPLGFSVEIPSPPNNSGYGIRTRLHAAPPPVGRTLHLFAISFGKPLHLSFFS